MWPEKNRVQFTQTLTPMAVSHHKNKIESKFSLSKHKIIVFNAVRMLIHTHSLSPVVIVTILYISPSNPSRLSCKVNGFLSPFKIEHSIVMIDYYYCIPHHTIPPLTHSNYFSAISLDRRERRKRVNLLIQNVQYESGAMRLKLKVSRLSIWLKFKSYLSLISSCCFD